MPLRLRVLRPLALSGASVLALAAPLAAQEAGDEAGGFVLPPITIFGDRAATTLDQTTASVAVVTEEQIRDTTLFGYRDAFRLMANVTKGDWTDGGFVIRGVNSEGLTPGGAPLASVYMDGVQQTVNGVRRGAGGMFDMEQMEVYRGPQSTLSGRAALAGAIYLKSVDPSFEPGGHSQVILGEDGRVEAGLAYGGTLVPGAVAWRLAAEFDQKDGQVSYPSYERYDRYPDFSAAEYWQIRGKLLVTPPSSPGTRALLSVSRAYDSPTLNDVTGPDFDPEVDFDDRRGDFNLPLYAEDRSAKNWNLGAEITHDLGDELRFTSMTAWSDNDTDRPSINEGTDGEIYVTTGDMKQSVFTQEFRLNYDDGRTRAVGGIYFAEERGDYATWRNTSWSGESETRFHNDVSTQAVFGEAQYRFAPGWSVIAGARLQRDALSTDGRSYAGGAPAGRTRYSTSETTLLPKAGLVYEFDAAQSLALVVQEGYRSGGAGINQDTGEEFTYDPEYAWNYEATWRGRFLEDRLAASVSAFYQDWRDQQVEMLVDPSDPNGARTVTNAANSHSWGFELDARYRATEALSLFAALGYVRTEFEDFETANGDFSGLAFPEAPEWTVTLGGRYAHPSGWFVGADARYVDGSFSRLEGSVEQYLAGELDSYATVNATAGYERGSWRAMVYADNIFDEEYFTYRYAYPLPDQIATLGEPREIGFRIEARF